MMQQTSNTLATTLLQTKLYAPPPHREFVSRERLINTLNIQTDIRLVLISAPTGFGKTSLLGDWVRRTTQSTGWLSLDERDNDPIRFLTYIISACQTIDPQLGVEALSLLVSVSGADQKQVITLLLNDLSNHNNACNLLMDDYQLITNPVIHELMRYVLEFLPDNVRLILSTRSDPPLPLARLRVQRQITEVRASDLQLQVQDVVELSQLGDLELSPHDIDALVAKTEGWAAGVQVVLLSLQNHQGDVGRYIDLFSGDHRHILTYLAEEVLLQQPQAIQDFLVQTSILDQLHGKLCDALTGETNGFLLLETIIVSNLFIEQLDNQGHWYRYHHLFREFLRNRLERSVYDESELYRRAVDWYESQNSLEQALIYAIRGQLWEQVVYLLITYNDQPSLHEISQFTILDILEALPQDIIADNPVLSLQYARTMFSLKYPLEPILHYVSLARTALENDENTTETDTIWGDLQFMEAEMALQKGDAIQATNLAEQAIVYLDAGDHIRRAYVYQFQGYIALRQGDVFKANQLFNDAITLSRQTQSHVAYQYAMIDNANALIKLGRLDVAIATYQQVIENIGQLRPGIRAESIMGLGLIQYEQNDLDPAFDYMTKGLSEAKKFQFTQLIGEGQITLAKILVAKGQVLQAVSLMQEAISKAKDERVEPLILRLQANLAAIHLMTGNLDSAVEWAHQTAFTINSDVDYNHEFELITYLHILALTQPNGDLISPFQRLIASAETSGRKRDVLEDRMILAELYARLGQTLEARLTLEKVLQEAIPSGYIRILVNADDSLIPIFREIATDGHYLAVIQTILTSLDQHPLTAGDLAEPLSERELQVLRLVSLGLSNRDIADQLIIGITTVKSHVGKIIAKLDATNRTQAVAKARELGIIE